MQSKIQIAPSILSADFANLERDVNAVAQAGADWIHVDVMDGHFVPNLTIGPGHVKALKRITTVPLDIHLMIDNPDVQLQWYIDAGADSITIHIEACKDPCGLIQTIHDAGIKAGISLNPETSVESILDVLSLVDIVLVMSVHPGFGGQSFIEESLDKISYITSICSKRELAPCIEVDGGININTAPQAIEAGAQMLVAGSAIFDGINPAAQIERIRNACS